MKDDQVYINHILEAIQSAEEYIAPIAGYDDFLSRENKAFRDAIVRQLEIVGEATKNLSQDFKLNHNEIPWRKVAGMRDSLIHDYGNVDLKVVWTTMKEDILVLKELLLKIRNL